MFLPSQAVCSLPIAAITNSHKLNGLKQHPLVTSQLGRSTVWQGSHWANSTVSAGCGMLWLPEAPFLSSKPARWHVSGFVSVIGSPSLTMVSNSSWILRTCVIQLAPICIAQDNSPLQDHSVGNLNSLLPFATQDTSTFTRSRDHGVDICDGPCSAAMWRATIPPPHLIRVPLPPLWRSYLVHRILL